MGCGGRLAVCCVWVMARRCCGSASASTCRLGGEAALAPPTDATTSLRSRSSRPHTQPHVRTEQAASGGAVVGQACTGHGHKVSIRGADEQGDASTSAAAAAGGWQAAPRVPCTPAAAHRCHDRQGRWACGAQGRRCEQVRRGLRALGLQGPCRGPSGWARNTHLAAAAAAQRRRAAAASLNIGQRLWRRVGLGRGRRRGDGSVRREVRGSGGGGCACVRQV